MSTPAILPSLTLTDTLIFPLYPEADPWYVPSFRRPPSGILTDDEAKDLAGPEE